MFLQLGFPEHTLILVATFGIALAALVLAGLATYAEHRRGMALIETGQSGSDPVGE